MSNYRFYDSLLLDRTRNQFLKAYEYENENEIQISNGEKAQLHNY